MVTGDQEEQITTNIANNYDDDLSSLGAEGFISIEGNSQKIKTTEINIEKKYSSELPPTH
jgi:hypothetical protein